MIIIFIHFDSYLMRWGHSLWLCRFVIGTIMQSRLLISYNLRKFNDVTAPFAKFSCQVYHNHGSRKCTLQSQEPKRNGTRQHSWGAVEVCNGSILIASIIASIVSNTSNEDIIQENKLYTIKHFAFKSPLFRNKLYTTVGDHVPL